ncbi:MAG: CHASE2 domain-containing protein [Elusimicrobia bacterium]|nr:CHASE2 domain-containing protein [Elusimicrobiota bacterium]
MKNRTLLLDALIGACLTLFISGGYLFQASFLESLEMKAYDARSGLRQSIDAGSREIVLVAIDDDSIARLGRWPWPRSRLAEMVDLLAEAKPRVIGLNVLLSEPERNQGLEEIGALKSRYEAMLESRRIVERRGVSFGIEFDSATARLDSDETLRNSLQAAGTVVLPLFFETSGIRGSAADLAAASLSSAALTAEVGAESVSEQARLLEGTKVTPPQRAFSDAVQGAVGHVNIFPDFDGVLRREYPAIRYGGVFYPSYALELVIRYLGIQPKDVRVRPGRAIHLGNTSIPLDRDQSMLITFPGPLQSFRYYSFHEILQGKVSMDVFRDKIVVLGPAAAGISTLYVTPVAHSISGVEVVASIIENMLHRQFIIRPEWAVRSELGAIAFVGLFIMFLLPRLRAMAGALLSSILLIAIVASGTYLFAQGQWLKIVYPGLLLIAGYIVVMTKRFLITERGKELVEASAIETNKMLGLSFQGQGMLDLAFDKFRLCPVDDQVKGLLYNLALDFERKRQYNKAVAVYEHVAAQDPKFKDIQEKMKVLRAAAEGAVFGGIGATAKEGTVLISEGASRPTLGRYEIEKELGRGAMGVVYLGRDPKINRLVAIKTMMLEEGTDPAALRDTKERFFREAESAGTLNHPNIVRIFDAGEENDVCYIAMEFLDGTDLARHTGKERLLPAETAMEYVAEVAEALDYAHAQGIVHRDVKPANIMLLKDGTIRVTDFGIARITASSKTATGTVMGTPSYMSPEQVAGRKVDGRSDLFSLGVALFEFLTGEKPFKGGDGIGTLLFQIANDPEPDPLQINPQLPACAAATIHRALQKAPETRYQRGSEMAADLRVCMKASRGEVAADGSLAPEPPRTAEEVVAATFRSAQPPAEEAATEASVETTAQEPPAAPAPPVEEAFAAMPVDAAALEATLANLDLEAAGLESPAQPPGLQPSGAPESAVEADKTARLENPEALS